MDGNRSADDVDVGGERQRLMVVVGGKVSKENVKGGNEVCHCNLSLPLLMGPKTSSNSIPL